MEFVHCDPHRKGLAILKGNGKKAWVWHNRKHFSDLSSAAQVTISGIPQDATRLSIVTHRDTLSKPP